MLKKLQEADDVWKEVIQWVAEGQSSQATESEGQSTGSTNCETVIQSYVICDT